MANVANFMDHWAAKKIGVTVEEFGHMQAIVRELRDDGLRDVNPLEVGQLGVELVGDRGAGQDDPH